jgi:hypothetical protein
MLETKYVQFSGDDEKKVVSVFAAPQNAEDYPNQGEIDSGDPRYIDFVTPAEPEAVDPVDKLKAFLSANPDVAEILK